MSAAWVQPRLKEERNQKPLGSTLITHSSRNSQQSKHVGVKFLDAYLFVSASMEAGLGSRLYQLVRGSNPKQDAWPHIDLCCEVKSNVDAHW